jgi:acetyltransferase-like isoleucine patch superfamily enzyme
VSTNVLVEREVHFIGCEFVGNVRIGYRSYANNSLFRNVDVGRFCSIGRRCSIGAAKHDIRALTTHPFGATEEFQAGPKTEIGHDVWIGDNVVITAGVKIGTGAVIGAGAIVTKDVPPYAIMAGVPARILRQRFDELTSRRLLQSRWWEYGDTMVDRSRGSSLSLIVQLLEADIKDALVSPHHSPLIN